MKTIRLLFVLFATVALYSCSNEQENLNTDKPVNKEFEFANQAEFDATVLQLGKMNDQELKAWSDATGRKSLYSVYQEALEEASLLNSGSDYLQFKEKYAESLYFPEVDGDYGPYLPLSNEKISVLLNPKGEVKINGETINLKDIHSYDQLVDLNRSIPKELRVNKTGPLFGSYEVTKGNYKLWVDFQGFPSCPFESSLFTMTINFRKNLNDGSGWVNFVGLTSYWGGFDFTDLARNPPISEYYYDIDLNIRRGPSPHIHSYRWPESYDARAQRQFSTCHLSSWWYIYFNGFLDPTNTTSIAVRTIKGNWEEAGGLYFEPQPLCR
jgi:hypothetical protein